MVEWKNLGDLCRIKTGKLNANAQVENGKYPFFTCDATPFRINTYAFDTEAILISGNGSQVGHLNYYKGKFNVYQRTYVLDGFAYVDVFYLFHYLKRVVRPYVMEHSKKGSVPYITLPMLTSLDIPVPSPSEQNRIVGILDTFTASIENLKEQIAQRRKQYEYYRDQLLDLEGKPGVEMKTLGEVCDFIRGPFGGALKKDIFVSNGYAIYEQQHAIYGVWNFRYFIDENKYNQMKRFKVEAGDILMSCSGTMGKTSIVPYNYKEGIINQALLKLSTKDDISNKYLKQFMDSQLFQDALKGKTAGGAIQNVASVSVLKDLTIPLPPLSEQQRIVSILDTFEASIQNLEAQLKEREKQYEYYRNKLLTFE